MILQQLKHDTRCYHQQIERTLNLETRCQSLDGYRDVLGQFYGFYAPVETVLAQVADLSGVLNDLDQRHKTQLIVQDLHALGVSTSAMATLPLCSNVPDLPGVPQALGCLYVLEGATLGGQIIVRQLQQYLGITSTWGSAFFNSYGPHTGSMWRTFGTQLSAYATTLERTTTILAAAQQTFRAFDYWLLDMVSD